MTDTESPPAPLAVDAAEAARLCGVSAAHWYAMLSAGRCPAGFRLGRRRLWGVTELRDWVSAGCLPRDRWLAAKK